MAISTNDFWRLLEDSRLHSAADCRDLASHFAQVKGAAQQGNAAALAEWLVAQRALTRYQAKILLGGRAGPFVYGDYQLRDRVSDGRFAGCFKAIHATSRHPVLLWFLTGAILESPQAYALAISQVAVACRTVHPCLVHAYQFVDLGRFKFIVCEEPAGTTADEVLRSRGRLTAPQACRVMWQVAAGTATLHALGATHGEIRPSNVCIDTQGNGRLLQVPFSREPHLPPSTPHCVPGGDVATAADYFAPELAITAQAPDALTDVYAMGCTLYELLSGQAPFAGGDAAAKMRRHATEAIQPLEPLGVPAQLAQVVAYAMAKDRRLRYPTSAQLAQALAYFVDPAQKGVLPQPAPTYAAFEAWRRTQPLAPSTAPTPPPTHSTAPPAARDGSAPWNAPATSKPTGAEIVASPVNPQALPPSAASTVDPAVSIVDAGHERTAVTILQRRKKHTRNNAIISMAAVLLIAMLGAVGFGIYSRDNSPETARQTKGNGDAQSNGGADSSAEQPDDGKETHEVSEQTIETADNGGPNTIADDGKTLWASPTSGPPITWAYLPARAEIALSLRPAELLRHPEGEKLVAALGPWGARARSAAEEILGRPLAEFEQLTVAWIKAGDGWSVALAARPANPTTAESLTAAWQNFQQVTSGTDKAYVSQGRAYLAPAAEQGKLLVVVPADDLSEMSAANPLPLSRDMAKLVKASDSHRLATLLFTRGALVVDAQPSLAAHGLGRLHDALSWLLPDDANGAALSLHLDQNCYLEARVVASVETTERALATKFQERMKGLAADVEALLSQIDLHPYGKTVLFRLDDMMRFLQNQLRIDADGDQVVINAYLPAVAAHNLALAAELTIVQPGADEPPQPISTPEPGKLQPATVAEKLKKPITFVQQRDTLEKAAQALAAEIGVAIEVLGLEFQPEGINRNNQFAFEAKDRPADEVLRSVLLAANPDGKLVYVIKSKDNGGPEAIVITTRAAAARRGDALPPELAAAPGKVNSPGKKK